MIREDGIKLGNTLNCLGIGRVIDETRFNDGQQHVNCVLFSTVFSWLAISLGKLSRTWLSTDLLP